MVPRLSDRELAECRLNKGLSAVEIADMFDMPLSAVNEQLVSNGLGADSLRMSFQSMLESAQIPYHMGWSEAAVPSDFYLSDIGVGVDVVSASGDFGQRDVQRCALDAFYSDRGKLFVYDVDVVDARRRAVLRTQLSYRNGVRVSLGARQCSCEPLKKSSVDGFLDTFHFQGTSGTLGRVIYGLVYENVLVACMSLGKSRFKSDCWEIIRYCTHPGYAVSGGFARLLKACTSVCASGDVLISYMDLNKRFTRENVYERNGFEFDSITVPDYMWCSLDGVTQYLRYETTKKRLVSLGFDESKTEKEIMVERGFVQVFGAGSVCYKTRVL